MKNALCYLNTDLDLTSANDLTSLTVALEKKGMFALHSARGEDGVWYATFEIDYQSTEPEQTISAMLTAIESLRKPLRTIWSGCKSREFDIGYECCGKPRQLRQGISCELLARMATVEAALRITLYAPARERDIVKVPRSSKRK